MDQNPYQPPAMESDYVLVNVVAPDLNDVRRKLRIPAIVLIVLASFSIALDFMNIVFGFFERYDQIEEMLSNIGGNNFLCIIHFIVLFAAVKMLKLQSYSTAKLGAILALIPLCTPVLLLGIPFGIWALVALNKPDVIDAFIVVAKRDGSND